MLFHLHVMGVGAKGQSDTEDTGPQSPVNS